MAQTSSDANPQPPHQAGPSGTRSTRASAAGANSSNNAASSKQSKPAEPVLNPAIGQLTRSEFPPESLRDQLAPEDLADSMLMTICSVFVAVNNRALCPKEIAEVMQYWGWTTPGSQPFAVVSTCIRTHLKRRGFGLNNAYVKQGPLPLVSSWDLTTTIPPEDQCVVGIEPHAKPAVKRGTLWYLSQAAGFPSPFGDRHPDSLFHPSLQLPKKGSSAAASSSSASLPKQVAIPKPRVAPPPPLSASMPVSGSPAWTPESITTTNTITPLLDTPQALGDLGRGKRKRKISSVAGDELSQHSPKSSASSPSQLSSKMASIVESRDGRQPACPSDKPTSVLPFPSTFSHRRTASSDPAASNAGMRRLKVKLNAPFQCPVFSHPIDNEDEEEEDHVATADVDMADPEAEEELDASINAETLASERRRFRKRSRSEGNILLATPITVSSPASSGAASSSTTTITGGYAPDYFAPAYAHGSASLPTSVSAPAAAAAAVDTWASAHPLDDEVSSALSQSLPDLQALDVNDVHSRLSSPAPIEQRRCSMPDYFAPKPPALDRALGSLRLPHSDTKANIKKDLSTDPADGEESAGEATYDFAFDEPEDTASTAATTPRSPVQVKEEPLDMDAPIFLRPYREQHSPMPDLPSLPIVTQAEEEDRRGEHHSESEEEEHQYSHILAHSPVACGKLFGPPRQRSLSPDESICGFAHEDSPSASVSRGVSPGNLSFSDAAPSPYSDEDEDLLLGLDDEQSDDEHMARQSLSPVVDLKELDLGFGQCHQFDSDDTHKPAKPFGPEVFGLLCHEPITPWQPSSSTSQLLSTSSEAFDVTVIPASDDFVDFAPDSSSEQLDLGLASGSSEPPSSPERPPPRISRRRLATAGSAQDPPTRTKAPPSSPVRSTRSSLRSTKEKAAVPTAIVDQPRHTRSASNNQAAQAAAAVSSSTARSTRSRKR